MFTLNIEPLVPHVAHDTATQCYCIDIISDKHVSLACVALRGLSVSQLSVANRIRALTIGLYMRMSAYSQMLCYFGIDTFFVSRGLLSRAFDWYVVSGHVMAIYLGWHMCRCHEPLVTQFNLFKYFWRVEYIMLA